MTKSEEIKICKDLMEKYKELDNDIYKKRMGHLILKKLKRY